MQKNNTLSDKIFVTHEKFRRICPTKILSNVEIFNSCFFFNKTGQNKRKKK